MASKRIFKKELNNMFFDIVDECYSVQLFDESKAAASDKLIDEAIEFRNNMSEKINKANDKKAFKALHQEAEDAAVDFIHKINGLN